MLVPVVAAGHLAGRPLFARAGAQRAATSAVLTGALLAAVVAGLATALV